VTVTVTRVHPSPSHHGGVEVIPKMFNIRYTSTVVFDARDSQLHKDYTIGL
jgi:hypothetical protein